MEILLYQLEKMVHRGNQHLKRFARTERAKRVKHDGKTTRVLLLRLQLESYIILYLACVDSLLDSDCTIIIGLCTIFHPSHQGLLITIPLIVKIWDIAMEIEATPSRVDFRDVTDREAVGAELCRTRRFS